jgi:hypothetical protein
MRFVDQRVLLIIGWLVNSRSGGSGGGGGGCRCRSGIAVDGVVDRHARYGARYQNGVVWLIDKRAQWRIDATAAEVHGKVSAVREELVLESDFGLAAMHQNATERNGAGWCFHDPIRCGGITRTW